jgi:hypothetical protein
LFARHFAPLAAVCQGRHHISAMHRKIRADVASLEDLHEAVLGPADRREGTWTRLELLEMDDGFRRAMEAAPERPTESPDRVAPAGRSRRVRRASIRST